MVAPVTTTTDASPEAFIAAVEHPVRRRDAETAMALMKEVTGLPPVMWGPTIVGFGKYHYVYDSGHSGQAPMTGFSPRKANMVFYVMPGFDGYDDLLARLGKHKTGVSCLYINKLDDVDLGVLRQLVQGGFAAMRARYGQ